MNHSCRPLKVVVIGYGRMGVRHAEVYAASEDFSLVGICGRHRQRTAIESAHADAKFYNTLEDAIANERPDLVCISTHIDSHDELSRVAIERDCHVFLEKPITPSVAESRALLDFAERKSRKLIVGYILHHDRLWAKFIKACNDLQGPIEIEIQLDQHSSGEEWEIHKKILRNSSIATDCAIHFFDIMSQAVNGRAKQVRATAARTHDEDSVGDNFLSATIDFSDGSTGTYASGWGPGFKDDPLSKISAKSKTAEISIVESGDDARIVATNTNGTERVIFSETTHLLNATHLQQEFVRQSITEDRDLEPHHQRALACMQIAAAADQSIDESKPIKLKIE